VALGSAGAHAQVEDRAATAECKAPDDEDQGQQENNEQGNADVIKD
jgi:hypothetical protein